MKKFYIFLVATLICSLSFGQQNSETYFAKVDILGYKNCIFVFTKLYKNPSQPFDNLIDKVFVLQTTTDYSGLKLESDRDSKVIKYKNVLVVENCDKKYLFLLSDVDVKNDVEYEVFRGYGLAEVDSHENTEAVQLKYLNQNAIISAYITPNGGGTVSDKCNNCASGGIGATSCSKSGGLSGSVGDTGISTSCSCEVSCGNGYYACCATCEVCKCCQNPASKSAIANNININVYPNPANSELNIELSSEYPDFVINIYNLSTGQLKLFEYGKGLVTKLNISSFEAGSYLVSCHLGEGTYSFVVMKQ